MICPSKICKAEIPEDSCFCDQCGIKILKCQKCGAFGISKFCGKCGGAMVPNGVIPVVSPNPTNPVTASEPAQSSDPSQLNEPAQLSAPVSSAAPTSPAPASPTAPTAPTSAAPFASGSATSIISGSAGSGGGTQIIRMAPTSIKLECVQGFTLECKNGNLLGRAAGDFVPQLSQFPVISSRHAQITLQGTDWFITDLGSTNKSYVNGNMLTPNVPVQIKAGDKVVLANVEFNVKD